MKSSRKTIFDLERRCDLLGEYSSILSDLYCTFPITEDLNKIKLYNYLDICAKTWPYRQGATSIESFSSKHGFSVEKVSTDLDALYSLELIINLLHWAPKYEAAHADYTTISWGASALKQECDRCIENITYLVERMNMRIREEETDPFPKYMISKRDANVDAVIETVPELSDVLLSYLDLRNQKDEQAKKNVLKAIADYLEPRRNNKCYRGTNYNQLCEDLFTVFNSASIRHNNSKQWNLRKPARMQLYDQTFKAAIHLLQMEDVKSFNDTVSDLKKQAELATEKASNTN